MPGKELVPNVAQKLTEISHKIDAKLRQPRYVFWRGVAYGVLLVLALHLLVTLYNFHLVAAYAEKNDFSKHFESQVSKDLALTAKCSSANGLGDTVTVNDLTSEARACYIAAGPEVSSWIGALSLSNKVSEYLLRHPEDTALTNAAALAITNGRADLNSKAEFYELEAKAYRAYNSSPVFLFRKGQADISYVNGEHFKTMLDAAELSIFAPGVALAKSISALCAAAPASVCERTKSSYLFENGRVVGINTANAVN